MGTPNFANRTLWTGDNLDILRGMNSECVDLIYLDPPFNSNRDYEAPVGSKAAGAFFQDAWSLSDLDVAWMGLIADERPDIAQMLRAAGLTHSAGIQSYLTMMAVRLLEMHRVLKPTGSIYLHCDPTASHYLKQLMDAIFGRENFRNEIVWCYDASPGKPQKWFPRKHYTILFYAKGANNTFATDGILVPYKSLRKRWGAYHPEGTYPKVAPERAEELAKGRSPSDWWAGISQAFKSSKEYQGYPTQKPLALIKRIILASSGEGDLVLDPFAGCATACVAAELLERQWVGIEVDPVSWTESRLS